MPITIDRDQDIPIYSPVCTFCQHLRDFGSGRKCDAFPDGIPMKIWRGDNDHTQPYPGDHDIQFEPVNEDAFRLMQEAVERERRARLR